MKEWEAATGADGEMVITFATPVTARFIKIQCQFDDRDRNYQPVNLAEFKHKPEELIKVYYTVSSRYEEYTYDAGGNRTQEKITLRMTESRDYSYYPNSNRLLTNGVYGYLYDANGNLLRKGTSYTVTGDGIELEEEGEYWEYRYDLLNRLTEVKKNGATVARYWYDETGLRVKKESGDGTIYYIFNQEGQVLYEEENQGYVEYIYLLGRHFARVDGDRSTQERTTYFYHTDHLGSTVLVTDATGATVWSTEYTPFGSLTFEEGKLKRAVKFTGKDLDEDTGLYYFNARWYDQSIGRFISEDPIKDGLNWYTYVGNNPLTRIDQSGLLWIELEDGSVIHESDLPIKNQVILSDFVEDLQEQYPRMNITAINENKLYIETNRANKEQISININGIEVNLNGEYITFEYSSYTEKNGELVQNYKIRVQDDLFNTTITFADESYKSVKTVPYGPVLSPGKTGWAPETAFRQSSVSLYMDLIVKPNNSISVDVIIGYDINNKPNYAAGIQFPNKKTQFVNSVASETYLSLPHRRYRRGELETQLVHGEEGTVYLDAWLIEPSTWNIWDAAWIKVKL